METSTRQQSGSSFQKDSLRVVVLGRGTVGKSSITLRFVMNTFTGDYVPTVQDTHRKNIVIDGELAQLEILDTAGQEEYEVMQDIWIKSGKGFLLVYSIDNYDSFKELEKIYSKIKKIRQSNLNTPIILCANKIDLQYTDRKVSEEEGIEYAKQINAEYVETSAKLGQNCNFVFENVVKKIRELEKPQKPVKQKKSFWDKCTLI